MSLMFFHFAFQQTRVVAFCEIQALLQALQIATLRASHVYESFSRPEFTLIPVVTSFSRHASHTVCGHCLRSHHHFTQLIMLPVSSLQCDAGVGSSLWGPPSAPSG